MNEALYEQVAFLLKGALEQAEPASQRERIATAALQGLLTSASVANGVYRYDVSAQQAVKYADALIAELAKPKGGV